ncbi:MAG: VapC toxin family PIN domain ribonuclease [Deltaproteobacteria bacterium]|nr:MAG: VapC toxin family PIN domain ribonuclease [Deltaproteobacteria bacterium]
MSYLLDTCVLSELIRPRPAKAVVTWLDDMAELDLHLSVLTLGELHKGIAKLPATSAKRRRLAVWVDEELVIRFEDRILPISAAAARRWGQLAGATERRGVRLPVIDALLAATALEASLAVVTRNAEHFERAGVRVVNPW